MNRQVKYAEQSPTIMRKLLEISMESRKSSLGATIIDLVNMRASQLNGCAFCVDMHSKEAKIHGERELRLYHLPVWRESPLFNAKERACLEWTEAVTILNGHGISDEIFERVSAQLSEKEISDVSFAVGLINFYNRMNISFPAEPGSMDEAYGLTKAGLK